LRNKILKKYGFLFKSISIHEEIIPLNISIVHVCSIAYFVKNGLPPLQFSNSIKKSRELGGRGED